MTGAEHYAEAERRCYQCGKPTGDENAMYCSLACWMSAEDKEDARKEDNDSAIGR